MHWSWSLYCTTWPWRHGQVGPGQLESTRGSQMWKVETLMAGSMFIWGKLLDEILLTLLLDGWETLFVVPNGSPLNKENIFRRWVPLIPTLDSNIFHHSDRNICSHSSQRKKKNCLQSWRFKTRFQFSREFSLQFCNGCIEVLRHWHLHF